VRLLKSLALILLTISLTFCDKPESLPDDNITYTLINKIITKSATDSVNGVCKNLIFEIKEINHSNSTAIIRLNNEVIECDGFNNIIVDSKTGNVLPLGEGQKVSENNNWSIITDLRLDDFAGKGEMYLGYRSGFYPSGEINYNYGWIKIELSSDTKILKIIEKATNHTENKFIKTGQKE
jgi:hypothetical protein